MPVHKIEFSSIPFRGRASVIELLPEWEDTLAELPKLKANETRDVVLTEETAARLPLRGPALAFAAKLKRHIKRHNLPVRVYGKRLPDKKGNFHVYLWARTEAAEALRSGSSPRGKSRQNTSQSRAK